MKNYANKVVNLDWLEVYCIEPSDLPAQYFKNLGWNVSVREYGTPLYREMFTLLDEHGKPFLEIRRNPYSTRDKGGIFEKGSCHIRLANRTLYTYNPIEQLRNFLLKYNYTLKGITRIDICCDQIYFDNGMLPQDLINKYMKQEILKNRNSRLSVHGSEMADGRNWNSLKWGSENSAVSTKIYDKTLELKQKSDKLYIKDCWQREGLCDLQKITYDFYDKKSHQKTKRAKMICVKAGTGTNDEKEKDDCEEVKIWRVEFSIKTDARNWVSVADDHKLTISLQKFDSRTKIMLMFLLLSNWCLDFVKAEKTNLGNMKRKDRCEKVRLYSEKNIERVYKPHRLTLQEDPSRTLKILYNKLNEISADNSVKLSDEDKKKCAEVAKLLSLRHGNYWLPDHIEKDEHKEREITKLSEQVNIAVATIDTFEGLDWVEDYTSGLMTAEQKQFIDRHKKDFVNYLLIRAQQKLVQAKRQEEIAQKDIDFWKGKTMNDRLKDIIFGIPLSMDVDNDTPF